MVGGGHGFFSYNKKCIQCDPIGIYIIEDKEWERGQRRWEGVAVVSLEGSL